MEETSIWKNPYRGFRMMWWDPAAMLLCAAFVAWQWPQLGEWALIAPFVLGNFFLFCNVFRVRRNAELIWAALFMVNSVAWLSQAPSLLAVVLTQLPITAAVLIYTVRSPGYRGIFSH